MKSRRTDPLVGFDTALRKLLENTASPIELHPPAHRLLVGYSGGLDSHVLLHLLAVQHSQRLDRTLEALYVDHGLQAASAAWGEASCARICRESNIPFRVLRIDGRPASGESPEAAARRARYAAFAAELSSDAALLVAHHRDDQAETLLLQLLRGAGPHGLAAMPAAARLGQGWLLRPLLDVDRAELLAYARIHGLRWIEDASNADLGFDRNYLRHRVLPLLRERWPAANRTLARSAQHCAETAAWLDAEAAADLAGATTERPDCLALPALRASSEPRQRNLLRFWLRRLNLPIPDARQLQQILHEALHAAADRNPCVRWPGAEVRRYQDALYAMPPLTPHDASHTCIWRPTAAGWPLLALPGVGGLRMEETIGAGLRAEALAGGGLRVRFRQGGERFRPVGRSHSQELKKLLQEASIPPWERERLPLLYLPPTLPSQRGGSDLLLAVVGLGIAADHAAKPGESGWQPVLQSPSAAGSGIV
ncbi:MAG: tRNA lysidine(34) synthetase TilS [Candidatus Competibacteraceae bacterium]|nr:tRNA lysidine(34) synthetase TilS [Candidatus Competibacteraceae bacterium]